MANDDPRIFKPEVEQEAFRNAVNSGYIRPDGRPAGLRARPVPVGGGAGLVVLVRLLPFIAALVAAGSWIWGVAAAAPRIRSVLTGALPEGWVSVGPEGAGEPLAVAVALGVVVLAVLTALLLTRRAVARAWVNVSGVAAFLVWLAVFAISALAVLVLILTPGLVYVGAAIATGADLASPLPADATARVWPLLLTAGAAAWFALGATRRAARKRTAHRSALHHRDSSWEVDARTPWHA